jgi:hypothetical protein
VIFVIDKQFLFFIVKTGNVRKRGLWEDPGADGRIILRHLQEVDCVGMDWIELAQVWDRWRASVNVVMNLRVPHNASHFLTS